MAKTVSVEDLVQEALQRALADAVPRRLHGSKAKPGVFLSSSAACKAAAARCIAEGLIRQQGEERTGRTTAPLYTIAPAGVAYVIERSPVESLLAATRDGAKRTMGVVAECQEILAGVRRQTEGLLEAVAAVAARIRPADLSRVLDQWKGSAAAAVTPPPHDAAPTLLTLVREHRGRSAIQPLPLPELYRAARARLPHLTMGQFHDALRQLVAERSLRLLPYTGAMYQLGEPEYGLLQGREVMYYAESC
jgi:hypothetical protein